MNEEKIPRRQAINYMLGAGFGALGLATFYPVVRYIIPSTPQGTGTNSVLAARVGDMKANDGLIFKFGNKPGILILKAGGDPGDAQSYVAFSAVCTHLGCTVQYKNDLKNIWCACHNGHFDLSGNVLSGPPPKPLQQYRVAIKGDEIFVSAQEA